ncbi:Putative cytochrome P450 E-class, group I [Podospora comata]|uniref:Cytochrome P450 E-class, group I n=1 Tax=Podospora comata TaxID=48703 RepID=A0ABY6SIX1_PODCO|nr:Putative cytochrome P450 E-class, group I [Podospora comata]
MAFALLLLLATVVALVAVHRYLNRQKLPAGVRPLPGPRGIPFIGRVHDIPENASWLKFYEWSKEYGAIYQMEIFGTVHVWISSEKVAHDLLSKRALIYSDRPTIPNLPDNRTSGDYLALLGRTETWKRQRKLCNHLMHTSALASLHSYPTRERDRFLYLMGSDPSKYLEWIEQFTSRTVSRLSWGTAKPAQILRHTTFGLLQTISPSGALPNIISFLQHVPLALSPWKKKEAARHALEDRLFKANIDFVRRSLESGRGEESFVGTFMKSQLPAEGKDEKERLKWGDQEEAMHVVGLMAIAGALTIGSPIQSYILAMCHYPEAQKALQEEIDLVCEGRCPQWEDREKLPMLRAVVKEVIRWRPPVPTGIPHAIEKDDVYEGYLIPKGATIHALEWGITRDEETYPCADEFLPARWVDPAYPTFKEPLTQYPNLNGFSQFGFGRRTCQGIPIVEQDLFLSMGGMAWAFDIRKKVDPVTGKVIPVHWNDYTPLLIAKPCKFDFDAIPRQEGRMEELRQMFDSAREEEEQQDKAITMDISQFEKDLGAEKIYRDKACEIRYADAAAQSDELEQTASEGSSTPLEPGLELGDSSSEADTESDFGKESLSTGMRVVLDGRVEKTLGIEPVVSVTGVPGAWKWA